jgi:tetratricopeptide (TPR) repeat protein
VVNFFAVPLRPPLRTQPRQESPVWVVAVAGCILILAAFAAYHNSFSGPFIYDDVSAIKDNPTIKSLWPLTEVLSPPSDSGATVNGRPLVNLSLAINYALGGLEVWGYHAFNLAIHILAGLTLFGLVRRTLLQASLRERFGDAACPSALAVAALWMLHPLQTESVTYVIQRAEAMVGLFYLLTLYGFARAVKSPTPGRWHVATVVAALLGMASKEVMVSAPLLVLLYDRTFVSGTFADAWRKHGRLYLGLAATWILLGFLVAHSGGRGGTVGFGVGGITSWTYALTQCRAIVRYLALAVWPSPLIFDYGVGVDRHLADVFPQAVLIVLLVGGTLFALWRRPVWGFLGAWFLAILAPSSSFLPIATETMAEHRMYLALAAVIALAVTVGVSLLGKRSTILFFLLAAGAGFLTARRNEDYRDELVIWTHAMEKYPANSRAHNNVGEILFRYERKPEAVERFREAVALLPNYVDALNNLGNVLNQLNQPAKAMPYLLRALKLKPDYSATYNNLGDASYLLGRDAEAVANFERAIQLKPDYADAHNNLGVVLAKLDQVDEAIRHYKIALKLKPNYADANYNYGNALVAKGQFPEAIAHFEATLQIKPNYPEAHNNMGGALFNLGKTAESTDQFEQALKQNPDYAEAHNNYGVLLLQSGKVTEALRHFEQALRLKPDYPDALTNLAKVRAQQQEANLKE